MDNFIFNSNPGRVLFGNGTVARLPDEAARLNGERVLVLSTPEQADLASSVAGYLGNRVASIFSDAQMYTPVEVTREAMRIVDEVRADLIVSVGGGSTTGLGKAIAFRTDLPQIVVPTTYAGSEATPILGETDAGRKTTKSDPRILPEVIVYDVDLTLSLPVSMSVTSGINAIAHAVEALYARDANPIISMMAEEAITSIARGLPRVAANAQDREARAQVLYGAWLCGVSLGSVGMALHHKLCHTLGGMFNLPHAAMHTAILPHALRYNADAAPAAVARVSRALGFDDAPKGLFNFAKGLGATMSLKSLGMPEGGIEAAVKEAMANAYWNPRPLEKGPLTKLLELAWAGEAP